MEVKCEIHAPGPFTLYGTFVGLHRDEHDEVVAVIRLKGHGMYLALYHPSVVTFTKDN